VPLPLLFASVDASYELVRRLEQSEFDAARDKYIKATAKCLHADYVPGDYALARYPQPKKLSSHWVDPSSSLSALRLLHSRFNHSLTKLYKLCMPIVFVAPCQYAFPSPRCMPWQLPRMSTSLWLFLSMAMVST